MPRPFAPPLCVSVLSLLFLLAAPPSPAAPPDRATLRFGDLEVAELGIYETDRGRRLVLGAYPSADVIYLADDLTGDVRFLTPGADPGAWLYGPRRNAGDETLGRVRLEPGEDGLPARLHVVPDRSGHELTAHRVPLRTVPVEFHNGDRARLAGWLLLPAGKGTPGQGPFPGAVMITQSTRFELWEVGLHLAADGTAVLLYDRRNAEGGESTGEPARGWYHELQRVYAADAAAAVDFLAARDEVDPARVGVVGWSGGGWMGAIVAGGRDDLAFYANVAGNASPWLEQAQHRLHARLFREGFRDEEIAEADRFLDLHHDTARGRVEWADYAAAREAVTGAGWYRYLSERFNITYDDLADARRWGSALEAAPPSGDYERVRTPALGLFFEHDHSSPPSTPGHFRDALAAAGNGDYQVVVLPDLNHGGWRVTDGYRWTSDEIEGRSPEVMRIVRDWVARQVAAPPAASWSTSE